MFKKIIFLIIIIFAFNVLSKAQEDSLQHSHLKLKKAIKEKLMEKLSINETTADKVIKTGNEQRKISSDFIKEKKQIMKYIEDNPDASDIMNKINDFIAIDDKINKSRKDFVDKLKTILTPKQIAQALILQKNLHKMFHKEKGR
jgi:hypothetical protein